MFYLLLIISFVIAFTVSSIVALVFRKSLSRIMSRLVDDKLASAWTRYILFALYVVGISSGVNIYQLERYIRPDSSFNVKGDLVQEAPFILTTDAWGLEIYRTVIGTLQGATWMLLLVFLVALIGYLIVRRGEQKDSKKK